MYDQLNRPIEYCTSDVDDPESFSRVIYQYTGAAGPFNITRYVSKNVPIKLVIPSNGFIGTFSYKWDQWGNMLEQAAIIDGDTIDTELYSYLCK